MSAQLPTSPAAAPSGLSQALGALTKNKLLLASLASGAVGAGAGGFLTARAPARRGEDPRERRRRILRNSLLLGAAAGGSVAGIGGGYNALNTAVPLNSPNSGAENAVKGLAVLGGAGAGGMWARKGFNEIADREAQGVIESILARTGKDSPEASRLTGMLSGKVGGKDGAGGAKPMSPREALRHIAHSPEAPDETGRLRKILSELGLGDPKMGERLSRARVNPAFASASPGVDKIWASRLGMAKGAPNTAQQFFKNLSSPAGAAGMLESVGRSRYLGPTARLATIPAALAAPGIISAIANAPEAAGAVNAQLQPN